MDPTPEQLRNRTRVFVVLRLVAALIAIGTGAGLVRSMHDGYVTLGIGDSRGAARDVLVLDTPLGRSLGTLFLEACAVFFAMLAIAPRYTLRPRVMWPTMAVVAVTAILMSVLFR